MDTASQSSPQILQILNPSSSTGIIANVGPMFSTSSSSLPSSVAIVSTTAAATSSTTNIAASNKQVRLNLGNQNFILVPAGSNLLSGVTGGLNSAIANNQNVTNLIASHHNSIVNKGKIMILTTASNPNLMGASTAGSGTILTHQNTLNNSPQQPQQQQQQVIRLNQIQNSPGSGGSTAPIFTLNSNASGGVPIASKSLPSSIISQNSVNSNNPNHPQNIIIATTNTNNNSHLNYQHFKSVSVGSPHQQSQPQFQILSTPTQNYQPQGAGSMSPVTTGLARFQSNQVSVNRNAFSIKSSFVANKANLRQTSQIIQTQPSKPSAAQLPDTSIVLNGTIEQEPEIIQSSVSEVHQVISAQTPTVQADNSVSSVASGSTSSLPATVTNITNQSRIETKVVETDKIMTVAESINNAKSQEVIEIDDEEEQEEEEMDDEEIMEINYNGDQCNELEQQPSKMMNVDTIDCAELDEEEGPDSSFEERAKNLYSDELLDRSSPELWPEKVPGVVKFLSGTSPTYFPKDDADDLLLPKTEENQKNSLDLKVVVKKETADSDSVSAGTLVNPNSVTTTPTRRQQSRKQSFVKKLNKSFSITPYGLASTNSRLPDYSRKQLNCFNSNSANASTSNANCDNGLGSSGTLTENDPIHHSDDSSTTSAHNFSLDNSVGKPTTKNNNNNNNSNSSACGGGKIVITKVPDWQKELDEDEIAMLYGYGSLTASALLDKVKEIQNLSYQLGLEEEREMTRARFLNIFNHYNQDESATPYSKRSNLIFSAEKEINFNSNDNYGEFFPRHLSEFGPGMLNNLNVSSTGSTK